MSETDGEGLSLAVDQVDDEPVVEWPPERLELTLRRPVTFGEEVVETILLREPTGEEWEEIFEHPIKTRRRFAVSKIAAIPFGAAAKMAIGDLVRADRYLYAFFEVGQTIKVW